jgi:hypothetical protein
MGCGCQNNEENFTISDAHSFYHKIVESPIFKLFLIYLILSFVSEKGIINHLSQKQLIIYSIGVSIAIYLIHRRF